MTKEYHRNALKPGFRIQWYEIKAVLGQGGFGITYLARDTNLDQDVAIKEYLPIELAVREHDATVQPATGNFGEQFNWGLNRFISEARTLAKFKHPNIVRVFSVFEANNTAYMIMEYEQGKSLQEILSNKKTLDESEIVKILYPILDGLEQVHEAGFIHRDIKPANIFIRENGSPVLLDFGSARQAMGVQTKTLTTLVSPGYAPIEQYYSKSDEQGPWTDIYSLAATVYRAICGRVPLDAVDRSKSLLEASRDTFVTLETIARDTCSERFLRGIDHGLKFKQQDRPQSIGEWKQDFDLEKYRSGIETLKTFEERPTQPGTRFTAPLVNKDKKPLYYSMVVVLLAIAGTYIYYHQVVQPVQVAEGEQPPVEVEVTEAPSPEPDIEQELQLQQEAERLKEEQEQELLRQQMEEERHQARLLAEEQRKQQLIEEERQRLEAERLALEQEKERLRREQEQATREAEEKRLAALKAKQEEEARLKKEREEQLAREQELLRQQKAAEKEKRLATIKECLARQTIVSEPRRLKSGTLYYAMIAVGKNNGWGESWGFDNKQDAKQVALQGCRDNDKDCRIEVWSNDCVALATGPENAAGWAWDETLNGARKKALDYCQKHTECCNVATAFCADEIE